VAAAFVDWLASADVMTAATAATAGEFLIFFVGGSWYVARLFASLEEPAFSDLPQNECEVEAQRDTI
jgi:hypothetical protein